MIQFVRDSFPCTPPHLYLSVVNKVAVDPADGQSDWQRLLRWRSRRKRLWSWRSRRKRLWSWRKRLWSWRSRRKRHVDIGVRVHVLVLVKSASESGSESESSDSNSSSFFRLAMYLFASLKKPTTMSGPPAAAAAFNLFRSICTAR